MLRERWHATDSSEQRRLIAEEGLVHIGAQLTLVRKRQQALDKLAQELVDKQEKLRSFGGQKG